MDIKQKIVDANRAYRMGTPVMSDQEFDDLVEAYGKTVGKDEFDKFRNSLHEKGGKVRHPYVMGSLDKLKAEEPETLESFLEAFVAKDLSISAKVDGISCRLHYEDGRLTSASTRGDGSYGEDISDKIPYVRSVPKTISNRHSIDVRGELVIFKDEFAKMTGFKNPRNATAGIMNRKDSWTKEDVGHITFVAYTILGNYFTKRGQFSNLEDMGFFTAWHTEWARPFRGKNAEQIVKSLTEYVKSDFPYEVDGLVLSDALYKNEDKYRPDAQVAFKINQLAAKTTLIDVSWEGPSKDGRLVPVGIVDPVELGGATISRVTLNNLDWIEERGLKYGSEVSILKSGDIIPKIVSVDGQLPGAKPIEYPGECPCCGAKMFRDGPHLVCGNPDCASKTGNSMTSFVKKLGIKNVSFATVQAYKILSYEALLKFKPNPKAKGEVKFYRELEDKMFSADRRTLVEAMNFGGVGTTILGKIFDTYGFDEALDLSSVPQAKPDGVGDSMFQKYLECLPHAKAALALITSDPRWSPRKVAAPAKKNGMSLCFTGTLNTMGRTEASDLARANGYDVKSSVCRGLTYLVTNSPDPSSSKGKKAKQYGVKLLTEDEFLRLMGKVNDDLDSL